MDFDRYYQEAEINKRKSEGDRLEEKISRYLEDNGIANTLTDNYCSYDIDITGTDVVIETKARSSNWTDYKTVYFPIGKLVKFVWESYKAIVILRYNDGIYYFIPKELEHLSFKTAEYRSGYASKAPTFELPKSLFKKIAAEELLEIIEDLKGRGIENNLTNGPINAKLQKQVS